VNVADIVRAPAPFLDKRITVTGVLTYVGPYNRWSLCPTADERAHLGRPVTIENPACIDLRVREPYERQLDKYRHALVTITGLYWHPCFAEVRDRQPAIVKDWYGCTDYALKGLIGVEHLTISGYVQEADAGAPDDRKYYVWPEPLLDDVQSAALDTFVRAFLSAVRARDTDALARLYPLNVRGFARVGLLPGNRLDWSMLSPEMRVTNAEASHRGTGYRIFVTGSQYRLCFCRSANCAGKWPTNYDLSLGNIASPTVCYTVQRGKNGWALDE